LTGPRTISKSQIGIGRWIQNIAVTATETLLITELFLPLDVAEMLWNFHVENAAARKIYEMVRAPQVKAASNPTRVKRTGRVKSLSDPAHPARHPMILTEDFTQIQLCTLTLF
jgi:hypothetical protein